MGDGEESYSAARRQAVDVSLHVNAYLDKVHMESKPKREGQFRVRVRARAIGVHCTVQVPFQQEPAQHTTPLPSDEVGATRHSIFICIYRAI